MLDKSEKEKIRPKYFRMIRQTTGWQIVYDDMKELDSPIFDISLFLTKTEIDEETKKKKQLYGFFQTTYNSDVSYDAYRKANMNPEDGGLKIIADKIDSQIYPYELEDVIAQLLHLGYKIRNVYKIDAKGKLNLNLNPDIIHDLIHQFCTQNSPLLDPSSAPKPMKMKRRTTKHFWNVEKFGKNGTEKIPMID